MEHKETILKPQKQGIMKRLLLMVCCVCLLSGCAGVTVKTHHGWMGPDTWEATDGKVSVSYYNGNCCCVAEEVLQTLADKANSGQFDWSKMADEKYKEQVLADTCWHVLNMPKGYR